MPTSYDILICLTMCDCYQTVTVTHTYEGLINNEANCSLDNQIICHVSLVTNFKVQVTHGLPNVPQSRGTTCY